MANNSFSLKQRFSHLTESKVLLCSERTVLPGLHGADSCLLWSIGNVLSFWALASPMRHVEKLSCQYTQNHSLWILSLEIVTALQFNAKNKFKTHREKILKLNHPNNSSNGCGLRVVWTALCSQRYVAKIWGQKWNGRIWMAKEDEIGRRERYLNLEPEATTTTSKHQSLYISFLSHCCYKIIDKWA